MCEIYGESRFDSTIDVMQAIDKVNLLSHRGPDGYGFVYGNVQQNSSDTFHNDLPNADHLPADTNYFLGHRRLSIVDLDEKALQPMRRENGNYQIVFNGEIYNYPEIKQELLELGFCFATDHSDTEVLLNAFIAWGQNCLDKLVGMYAFAIFDRCNERLFLARDRIGQKPLYYSFSDKGLVFCSEITPMLKYGDGKFDLDEQGLRQYLIFGYVPTPRTLFQQIRKLPAASYAWVDLKDQTFEQAEYWDVPLEEDVSRTEEEWLGLVSDAIRDSVRLRLRADVPIGAFASGGIDSTLIVKSISELMGGQADTYAADFPEKKHTQREYVQEVSETYNTNTRIHMIGMNMVRDYKEIIAVFDEPFDGASSIALYELFRNAKEDKKVILTGDGGDELFAGYPRYARFFRLRKIKAAIDKLRFGKRLLSFLNERILKNRQLAAVLDLSVKDYVHRYDTELTKLLIRSTNGHAEDDFPEACTRVFNNGRRHTEKAIQYIDLKTLLPGRMLYKLDRFSMRFGIEARSPLLDHRVVELAHQIPAKFNVNSKTTKLLLKKILKADFGEEFLYRRKQGFGNPLNHWFKNEESRVMFDKLGDRNSTIYNYLDYEKLHDKFPEILGEPRGTNGKKLWRLIVLAHYLDSHRRYLRTGPTDNVPVSGGDNVDSALSTTASPIDSEVLS